MILANFGVHGAGVNRPCNRWRIGRFGTWFPHVPHGSGIELRFALGAAKEKGATHVLGSVKGLVRHRHAAHGILQSRSAAFSCAFVCLMRSAPGAMVVRMRVFVVLVGIHGISAMFVRSARPVHREAR